MKITRTTRTYDNERVTNSEGGVMRLEQISPTIAALYVDDVKVGLLRIDVNTTSTYVGGERQDSTRIELVAAGRFEYAEDEIHTKLHTSIGSTSSIEEPS